MAILYFTQRSHALSNAQISCRFVGTFTLVFIGTAVAVLQGMGGRETGFLGISLAFGGTLMVLVLVIGPVSGCHVNPAVTLAMCMAGRLEREHLWKYIGYQVLGGLGWRHYQLLNE